MLLAAGFGLLAAVLAWSGRYALGLARPASWTVPVELYDEALADLDAALTAARAAGLRNDELARELARMRSAARTHPIDPIRHAEPAVASDPPRLATVTSLPRQPTGAETG